MTWALAPLMQESPAASQSAVGLESPQVYLCKHEKNVRGCNHAPKRPGEWPLDEQCEVTSEQVDCRTEFVAWTHNSLSRGSPQLALAELDDSVGNGVERRDVRGGAKLDRDAGHAKDHA
jgi:hypothetical protein